MKTDISQARYPRVLFWILICSLWYQSTGCALYGQSQDVKPRLNIDPPSPTTLGSGFATSRVYVKDEKNAPMPGVKITFELLPAEKDGETSAVFRDDGTVQKETVTDGLGMAEATQICPVGQGVFNIKVTAVNGSQSQDGQDEQKSEASSANRLAITVLQGQDAINDIRPKHKTFVAPQVLVSDADSKQPVACAKVTFNLPKAKEAAGATFQNKVDSAVFWTDQDGKATGDGFTANETPGKFTIGATASIAHLAASPVGIRQKNDSGGHALVWVLLGVAAAGGGACAAFLCKKTQPPPPSPQTPISISAGTGSVVK